MTHPDCKGLQRICVCVWECTWMFSNFYSMSFSLVHVTLVLTPGWVRHLLLTTSIYILNVYFVVIVSPQKRWQFFMIFSVVVSSMNRFLQVTWMYFPYTITAFLLSIFILATSQNPNVPKKMSAGKKRRMLAGKDNDQDRLSLRLNRLSRG